MQREPKFVDAHTHVQFGAFDADRDAVVARARDAGIWMVNVGTQRDTSRAAVELAEKYEDGVYAAIGLHPVHTSKSFHDAEELGGSDDAKGFTSRGEVFDMDYYKGLAMHPKTVAIGECGLDYYRLPSDMGEVTSDKEKQKKAFIEQIKLAQEVKKPLMIHCRQAFNDLIDILVSCHVSHASNSGIIHFFTGTVYDAAQLLDLGFSFTFGGVVTFTRDYDKAIKLIPLDRILSETDAPYVTPVPYRGKRNEPAYVVETVKKLAELKDVSPEEMKEQIWKNARRIFSL